MRFATYKSNGLTHAGIFFNEGYYPIVDLMGDAAKYETTILDFIRLHESRELPDFHSIIEEKGLKALSAENIELCAPIPEPFRNVICLGKNYADHAKELTDTAIATPGGGLPEMPVFFSKNANPAVGDCQKIPLHEHFTKKVDYEAELAIIIGKTAWRIEPGEAEDVIFGYTVLNDVTARNVQISYGQWYFGKSLDSFCPMGPHIVTKDELPFPLSLDITCRVNGEIRQKSNTANLIFDISRVISELSQGMKLLPGDIIATGTPGGVGHGMKPPVYLKKGDKVECEIEKVGVLTSFFE